MRDFPLRLLFRGSLFRPVFDFPTAQRLEIYYSLYVWVPPLMFTYSRVSRLESTSFRCLKNSRLSGMYSIFPIWHVMFNCPIQVTVLLSCLPWWIRNWCPCFGSSKLGMFSISSGKDSNGIYVAGKKWGSWNEDDLSNVIEYFAFDWLYVLVDEKLRCQAKLCWNCENHYLLTKGAASSNIFFVYVF